MGLNPFKDSNLNDLQQNVQGFIADHFGGFAERCNELWKRFLVKGRERLTIMFIPHSEKRIVNFHISIFAISFLVSITIVVVTITSVLIINHSSTIKEVSKLKKYGNNSRIQIKKYKEEISKLYLIFQKFKPEITHLYSLTPGSNIDSLWAKGGVPNTTNPEMKNGNEIPPPIEILNIQEVERELKTTKKLILKIKKFLNFRKKIIENTPSVWPIEGYIISRYGQRSCPYTFKPEFYKGIDIEAYPGAEVRVTAPGVVKNIRWDPDLGLTVSIKHKYGFVTSYSHCQRLTVKVNQKVSKNEIIGYVGRTGRTTRYICYYQIKIGTEYVDPLPYLNRISR
ncbi:M23 family metallopeptidase [Spirochaetota bacterium]